MTTERTMQLSVRCKDGRITTSPRITSTQQHVTPGRGRPMAGADTVVTRMARERGMNVTDVSYAMGCSQRTLWNYTTRLTPVPTAYVFGLCDRLDVDPEEIIDQDGYFKLDVDA